MVFFTKESSLYGYVVKASPKLKGENSLICTIDSKQFVKYDKDKNNMKSFLSSSTLVVLRSYLQEGTREITGTNNCRSSFNSMNKFLLHLLESHNILDTSNKSYYSDTLICAKCQALKNSSHSCGRRWYCSDYMIK